MEETTELSVKVKVKNIVIDLKDLVNLCSNHCEECPYFFEAIKD